MRKRSTLYAGSKIKIPYYNKKTRHRRSLSSTQHVVRRGENLSMISRRYRIKIGWLKKINRLSHSTIYPGQILRLSQKTSSQKTHATSRRQKNIHVVKRGETLIGIAKKYNISLLALMKKNAMTFHSTLITGKRIIIPR